MDVLPKYRLPRFPLPVWLLTGVFLLFGIAVWWRAKSTADEPMTHAEALAALPANLAPPIHDPEAQQHYAEISKAAKFLDDPQLYALWRGNSIRGISTLTPRERLIAIEFLARHKEAFARLEQLLNRDWPVETPPQFVWGENPFYEVSQASSFFAMIAREQGNTSLAAHYVALSAGLFSKASGYTGSLGRTIMGQSASDSLFIALKHLKELSLTAAQYREIVDHMPPSQQLTRAYPASVICYFHQKVLPAVLDPRKPRAPDPQQPYNQFYGPQLFAYANYKKRETLKTLAVLYSESIQDLNQEWDPGFRHLDRFIHASIAAIPPSIGGGTSSTDFLGRILTSNTFRNTPNLLGSVMILDLAPQAAYAPSGYERIRCQYEAARLLFAFCAYKKEHAKALPGKLSDLVSSGVFRSLPLDPYTGKPFLYDPIRGVLWSTGANKVDDGGSAAGGSIGSRDTVFRLF